MLPPPSWLRHRLCLVLPPPLRLRRRLCLVLPPPLRLRRRLCLVLPPPLWLRHRLCLVLPPPSWLKRRLCLAVLRQPGGRGLRRGAKGTAFLLCSHCRSFSNTVPCACGALIRCSAAWRACPARWRESAATSARTGSAAGRSTASRCAKHLSFDCSLPSLADGQRSPVPSTAFPMRARGS